jgi:hypothetical protein
MGLNLFNGNASIAAELPLFVVGLLTIVMLVMLKREGLSIQNSIQCVRG